MGGVGSISIIVWIDEGRRRVKEESNRVARGVEDGGC